jgi:hypothetical protein
MFSSLFRRERREEKVYFFENEKKNRGTWCGLREAGK